jgi:hypothetical protein
VDAERRGLDDWTAWVPLDQLAWTVPGSLDASGDQFLAVQFELTRGARPQEAVTVYLGPRSHRVVAVDR